MSPSEKHIHLKNQFARMSSALVAYSGGADSALVAAVGFEVLGDRLLAVTAHSPSVPMRERQAAADIASQIGFPHRTVLTGEMNKPEYTANPVDRCYHCKTELYSQLRLLADREGWETLANGTNVDDLGDHRPGLISAQEHRIISPLVDAGLNKQDVRELSEWLSLPTWNKPAMPCLSSRIPYGQPVTENKLKMIEQAEDFLISLGYRELRVRHFGDRARIELPPTQIEQFRESPHWPRARQRLSEIGFQQVELDAEGFRSGRLNAGITQPSTSTA